MPDELEAPLEVSLVFADTVAAVLLTPAVPAMSTVLPCSFVLRLYVVPLTVTGEPPTLKVELPNVNCVAEFAVSVVPSSVTTTGAAVP